MRQWRVLSRTAEQTTQLGRWLGEALSAPAAVLLEGDLGAGKTCFARGLARGLGVPESEPVTSPSYTLMNPYRGRCDLYHFDLYRLGHADELLELGFEEYLYGDGVTVVEWAERAGPLPVDGIRIDFAAVEEEHRILTWVAHGTAFEGLLADLARRWQEGKVDQP